MSEPGSDALSGARKSVGLTLLANIFSLGTNAFLLLVLPRFMSLEGFAYWQLYWMYVSLVGLLHLGLVDGLLLRFGGARADDLDKPTVSSQFWLLGLLQAIFCVVGLGLAWGIGARDERFFVFAAVCLNFIITNLWTYLQYLLQAIGEARLYAINLLIQRVCAVALMTTALAVGQRSAEVMIAIDTAARVVGLLLLVHLCRRMILTRPLAARPAWQEALRNISVGVSLLLANASGLLILTVYRSVIERGWGLLTFGKVSLVISVANMVIAVISAVGVVLFPILRRLDEARVKSLYTQLRSLLAVFALSALLTYGPGRAILEAWLPGYADSFAYLVLLYPICVYEVQMTVLAATYLKALRMERTLLAINLAAVALATLASVGLTAAGADLSVVLASLVVVIASRAIVAETIVTRRIGVRVGRWQLAETALVLTFVAAAVWLPLWPATGVYALALVVYLAVNRRLLSDSAAVLLKKG